MTGRNHSAAFRAELHGVTEARGWFGLYRPHLKLCILGVDDLVGEGQFAALFRRKRFDIPGDLTGLGVQASAGEFERFDLDLIFRGDRDLVGDLHVNRRVLAIQQFDRVDQLSGLRALQKCLGVFIRGIFAFDHKTGFLAERENERITDACLRDLHGSDVRLLVIDVCLARDQVISGRILQRGGKVDRGRKRR